MVSLVRPRSQARRFGLSGEAKRQSCGLYTTRAMTRLLWFPRPDGREQHHAKPQHLTAGLPYPYYNEVGSSVGGLNADVFEPELSSRS
jgi:hypothetical protein